MRNNGRDRVTERERSQPKSVKPKIGARKLRTCVYWQGALKHKKGKTMVACNKEEATV